MFPLSDAWKGHSTPWTPWMIRWSRGAQWMQSGSIRFKPIAPPRHVIHQLRCLSLSFQAETALETPQAPPRGAWATWAVHHLPSNTWLAFAGSGLSLHERQTQSGRCDTSSRWSSTARAADRDRRRGGRAAARQCKKKERRECAHASGSSLPLLHLATTQEFALPW